MSRIEDGYEPDDTRGWLMSCAFTGNIKRALQGRKGQAVLRELEEALLALPEKKLISGVFAEIRVSPPDGEKAIYNRIEGEVCTMGCLLVHRKMKRQYRQRGQALLEAVNEVTCDQDDGGQEAIQQAATALDLVFPLAYELAYVNDEESSEAETPKQRYDRVLAWVQSKIWRYSGWHKYLIPPKEIKKEFALSAEA